MTALVEADNLVREYLVRQRLFGKPRRIRAVAGVSLSIEAGTTFGLVGESGSGKSTLSRLLLAMEPPTSGAIRFESIDVQTLRRDRLRHFRMRAQAIFQDPYSALPPHMRIRTVVTEPFRIQGVPTNRRIAAEDLINEVGLSRRNLDQYPGQLSGGQRQRVVIARALALRPSFVVCDEPVSALDVSIQANILGLLRDLQRAHHLTYLFVSHDLAVVRAVADTIGVMYRGQLVEVGPSDTVYESGRHSYTRALISAIPTIDATRLERSQLVDIDTADAEQAGCSSRPFCRYATDVCVRSAPSLQMVDRDHWVACHHHDELPKGGAK